MKKISAFAVAAGVAVVIIAIVLFTMNGSRFSRDTGDAVKQEVAEESTVKKKVPKVTIIEKTAIPVEQETAEKHVAAIDAGPEAKVSPVKPDPASPQPKKLLKKKKSYYANLRDEIRILFEYLDGQEYVKAYALERGSEIHFLELLARLSANPPVIEGETKDIFMLTRNMAHFYRVMGNTNIFLGKEILINEKEIKEPAIELIYEWTMEEIKRKNPQFKTSLNQLYEYAGFFLTTLSGRAYLSRRDSKTRILVLYYSILILDKANRGNLNYHGIDILPPLNLLIDDISNHRNLDYRRKYLARLTYIKKKTISGREKGLTKY
jgi:hypothetical protein